MKLIIIFTSREGKIYHHKNRKYKPIKDEVKNRERKYVKAKTHRKWVVLKKIKKKSWMSYLGGLFFISYDHILNLIFTT